MDMCRTCLHTPANKHISELEEGIKDGIKNCTEIMQFCLDIEVTHDSKITTNVCSKCYRKIISFYKFKTLSLENDRYLKSLNPVVTLDDQKLSLDIDENIIKEENSLDSNDLVDDCDAEIKFETNVEYDTKPDDLEADIKSEHTLQDLQETDNEPLCDIEKECEKSTNNIKRKARVYKKRIRRKKTTKEGKLDQERHVCEECGKSVRNIKEHSLSHQSKEKRRMVQCKACPKVFATFGGRYRHYRVTHLGLVPKCDICNKEVRDLKAHTLRVHNPSALPLGCVSCERRFGDQFALDLHLVSHTKDPKFECDLCQKKFRLKHHVLKHIRKVHENEKNYQCDVCAKPFFDKAYLKRHLRTHSKERRYKCEECGLALKTKDILIKHLMIHSDVTKFQCKVCNRSFKRPEYLSVHMVTHTKEKRFACSYCGVRFGRSHHRSRHEFTAHKQYLETK